MSPPESFIQYCETQGIDVDLALEEWEQLQKELAEFDKSICKACNKPHEECRRASCDCEC